MQIRKKKPVKKKITLPRSMGEKKDEKIVRRME